MNWKKRKKRNRILKRHGLSSWIQYQMILRMCSETEYLHEKYGRSMISFGHPISMIYSKYLMKATRKKVKIDVRKKRIGTGKSYWTFDKYSAFMRQQLYGE